MEPIDYLRALRAKWRWIALAGLVGLVAAWVTTPSSAPVMSASTGFTATHTLIVESSSEVGTSPDLGRVALMVRTGEVPRRVAERLGRTEPPAVLATRVNAVPDTQARSLAVTVTSLDGAEAADLANAFAEETLATLEQRERDRHQRQLQTVKDLMDQLQRQSIELETQIGTLPRQEEPFARARVQGLLNQYGLEYQRLQQLSIEGPRPVGLVTLEEASPVPLPQQGFQAPASRTGRMLIAGPLGLLLGAALALGLRRIDPRISTKEEAEQTFGLDVLAEVPLLPRAVRRRRTVVAATDPTSPAAESFRMLRTSVRLMPLVVPGADEYGARAQADSHGTNGTNGNGSRRTNGHQRGGRRNVLLVTSAAPAEGKTTTVTNLAASFASAGESVLILDFDLRRPQVHRDLGLAPSRRQGRIPGLPVKVEDLDSIAERSSIPGVRVVKGWMRAADGTEVLDGGKSLMEAARQLADVVIVDSPPLLVANDASELIPVVDAVLVVCRSGRTLTEAAQRTSELLSRLQASVLGVVLMGVPNSLGRRYYHYRYGPEPAYAEGRASVEAQANGNGSGARPPAPSPGATAGTGPDGSRYVHPASPWPAQQREPRPGDQP